MAWIRVRAGDWIGSIAAEKGHDSWQHIWDHANNRSLRSRRDPNLLVEGDKVFVPGVKRKRESGNIDALNPFVVEVIRDKLVVRFEDLEKWIEAFGEIEFKLEVGSQKVEGKLSDPGQKIEVPLPIDRRQVTLEFGGLSHTLDIGALEPAEKLAGMQARTGNLGIDPGPIDGQNGPLTRSGVRQFQEKYDCKVDGIIGSETRGKAKERYGC